MFCSCFHAQIKRTKSRISTSSSSGVESCAENARKNSSPVTHLDIFYNQSSTSPQKLPSTENLITLQQENIQLQEENSQLHKRIEQLYEVLIETQKNLVNVQQQLIISQNEQQIKQLRTSISTQGRKRSTQIQSSAITEEHQTRIRKLSRSLDSIQHAVMMMQFDNSPDMDYPPPGFHQLSTSSLRKKSYK